MKQPPFPTIATADRINPGRTPTQFRDAQSVKVNRGGRPFLPLESCYGRLTVIQRLPNKRVECICSCGSGPKSYLTHALRSGETRSCGCLGREMLGNRKTHGATKTKTYRIWSGMKRRCFAPADISYPNYGGRGITVCPEWRESFEAFLRDMGERPAGFSIDRIDNNGNYEPSNCRWATDAEQAHNRSSCHFLTIDGATKTITDWSRICGLSTTALRSRMRKGWTQKEAVFTPRGFYPDQLEK